jgi:hypothetical protein
MKLPDRFASRPCRFAALLAAVAMLALPGAARGQITVGSDGSNTVDNTQYTGNQTLTKVGTKIHLNVVLRRRVADRGRGRLSRPGRAARYHALIHVRRPRAIP